MSEHIARPNISEKITYIAVNISCLALAIHTFVVLFLSFSHFFPTELFCKEESIKTVHLSEKYLFECVRLCSFITGLCTFLCECVNLWYFQMCAHKHLVWCLPLCMCVWKRERGGEGSPGAWQYGGAVLHSTPVKTPPMGPGQLWPTYTDSCAITSLVTHFHAQTHTSLQSRQMCLALWPHFVPPTSILLKCKYLSLLFFCILQNRRCFPICASDTIPFILLCCSWRAFSCDTVTQ